MLLWLQEEFQINRSNWGTRLQDMQDAVVRLDALPMAVLQNSKGIGKPWCFSQARAMLDPSLPIRKFGGLGGTFRVNQCSFEEPARFARLSQQKQQRPIT